MCAAAPKIAGSRFAGTRSFMGTLDARLVALDARNGRADLDGGRRGLRARLLDHARAARGQGQGHRRRWRRRVGHPWICRRVRCRDGQGGVALLHRSRAGRARFRDLVRRRVEDGRRIGLAHGHVRSGAEPHLLGHRQSGTRLQPGPTARRQPLHRFGRRARCRHRRASLAFPVHAERRVRLRRGTGARARGHDIGAARRQR